jgi:hypothetical protein
MTFNVGDRVSITKNHEDLPHPQYLYAGMMGTVINVRAECLLYIKPDVPQSGGDRAGVPFYSNELTLVPQQAHQSTE